jgi:hypothetical protein
MSSNEPWRITRAGIVLEQSVDDRSELLWINPRLLPAPHPLRVELLCSFADLRETNSALREVGEFFRRDSTLAAVIRVDAATRVLVYSATWESIVRERFSALRAVLRPTSMGLRLALDAAWTTFTALRSFADSALRTAPPGSLELFLTGAVPVALSA